MIFVAAKVCHLRNIDYKVCYIDKEKSFNVTIVETLNDLLTGSVNY